MEKKIIARFSIVLLCLPLFFSCVESTPAVAVLYGNFSYGKGEYQKAILNYINAQDTAKSGLDVVIYNLGNVYYALGEGEAALQAWTVAENITGEVDILFRIAFNQGVLYYKWGRYDEAYRSFRRALTLNPSDIDSKINLEDSFSRIRSEIPQSNSSVDSKKNQESREKNHLLDYIKRKEAEEWSEKTIENNTSPRDW